jgi:hypothetical protein
MKTYCQQELYIETLRAELAATQILLHDSLTREDRFYRELAAANAEADRRTREVQLCCVVQMRLERELAAADKEIWRLRDEIARLRDELCAAQETSK